jgi:hypothetical protein
MHPKITNLSTNITPMELVFFCAGIYKDPAPPEPFSVKKCEAFFVDPVLAEPKTGSVGAKSL